MKYLRRNIADKMAAEYVKLAMLNVLCNMSRDNIEFWLTWSLFFAELLTKCSNQLIGSSNKENMPEVFKNIFL